MTQGNREAANDGSTMTVELLHARSTHRRAEMLKLLPKCTRDAPDSWAQSPATLHAKNASTPIATPYTRAHTCQLRQLQTTLSATTSITSAHHTSMEANNT
eukprot:5147996-Pleurochrysis_carterae.AAC.1